MNFSLYNTYSFISEGSSDNIAVAMLEHKTPEVSCGAKRRHSFSGVVICPNANSDSYTCLDKLP